MYCLIILFSFPLLGSVVYFAAIYLPASRMDRGVRKVANVAANGLSAEQEKAQQHWSKHTRSLHQPLMRRVDAAISEARK